MRRSRPEWLLLPLFLLPFVLGAVLLLLARQRYVGEVEAARHGGERVVRDWIAEGPDWRSRFLADALARDAEDDVPFRLLLPDGRAVPGRARVPGAAPEPWTVAERYPGSVGAEALADPDVRLALESGAPAALAEAADPAAREFAELLAVPDAERLRLAPLPAATKRFVLHRWGRSDAVLGLLAAARAGLPPGLHPAAGAVVVSGGAAWPQLVLPQGAATPAYADGRGALRLTFGAAAPADAVWSGRLEEPLAGTWALAPRHGGAWWRDERLRAWAGPAGAALLALLLLPAALLLSLRKQRRLDEARVRFITELAHDLRTPLTAVRLHAEMLASGRAPEEKRPVYLASMARESARLSGLLANLLDLSRLERGTRQFERERIPVRAAAEEAARDFAALFPERAEDLALDGPDVAVLADRTALARCLGNLLENAGKFTAAGTAVRVTWSGGRGGVRVRVADEGPGVPPGERARLFERFARGARTNGVPGTGLGLSLVRELAEGMGGSVALVDAERGAAFELALEEAGGG